MNSLDDIAQFARLNADVQLLVLENVDTATLLTFVETNQHFAGLAANVFKRVHSKKTVKITNLYHETPVNTFDGGDIRDTDDEIIIQHFGTVLKVMKYFGSSISHISLDYNPNNKFYRDNSSMIALSQAINGNCSDTLQRLDLCTYGKVLEEMSKPFKQVKRIYMRGAYKDLGSDTLSFGELFPMLERIHLEYIVVKNTSCIDQNFPKLKHLDIFVPYTSYEDQFTESEVRAILRKNPQIRSLNIDGSNKQFLRYVNDVLPNLLDLKIRGFDKRQNDDQIISFNTVKNLTIDCNLGNFPTNLKFENLVELKARSTSDRRNGNAELWTRLAQQSQNLKKLFVIGEVSKEQLNRLEEMALSLDEVSLQLDEEFQDEFLINFVQKSDKIKKIHLARFGKPYSLKPVAIALRESLGYLRKITESVFQLWIE